MKLQKIIILLSIGFIQINLCFSMGITKRPGLCSKNRGVIEIGSSRIKYAAYSVDHCDGLILETLTRGNFAAPFLTSASIKNQQITLDVKLIKSASDQINQIIQRFNKLHYSPLIVVATGVFRNAINRSILIEKIKNESGVKVKILSVEEEAASVYHAVKSHKKYKKLNNLQVWDIGANDFHLVNLNQNNNIEVFSRALGSHNFMSWFMKKFTKDKQEKSPKPIGQENVKNGLEWVNHYFTNPDLLTELKAKIKKQIIVGIGGVHIHSILNNLKTSTQQNEYSYTNLLTKINEYAQLEDSKLPGKYKKELVTNMILVAGWMKYFEITHVQVADIQNTRGLLFMF